MIDLLGDILRELFVVIAADELRELLDKLLNGEDLFALVQSGDAAALALADGFADAGIDPDLLTDRQWGELAAIMLPAVSQR